MKKAQVATEAAIIISFMTLAFILFFFVISDRVVVITEQKRANLVADLGGMIRSELTLAGIAEDGYERTISLASTLDGLIYNISLENSSAMKTNFSEAVINVTGYQYIVPLSKFVGGELCQGNNLVRKRNSNVSVTCT
tara:strand:- start:210 stop:623 length:414 start_codon:yes stop_codon:yes gene_type:complete